MATWTGARSSRAGIRDLSIPIVTGMAAELPPFEAVPSEACPAVAGPFWPPCGTVATSPAPRACRVSSGTRPPTRWAS